MAEIYGTTTSSVPGDSVEVRSGGTVAISAAFETTLGLVGGMDTANGTATPGEVTTIESSADAETQFGENSELAEQVSLALQQGGISTIYAVPVSETETTETVTGTQSGTLSNVPLFDIRVHDDESISVQDTSEGVAVDVEMADQSPPATPTDANTIAINPNTGEFEADESSDYDITYSYGDYDTAIQEVVKKVPRSVGVLSENTQVANTLLTELNTYDVDFEFMHGYVGASPSTEPSSYNDNFDDRRLSVVAPSRGWLDEAETDQARTIGAVAGKQSGKPLGDSTTYEGLAGFTSLTQSFTNSEIGTLVDSQVLPLANRNGLKVIKDMTTSQDAKFERVAFSEITDEAAEISHRISSQFLGDANTDTRRFQLAESHRTSYGEMEDDDLLENYAVTVSEGATDNEVVLDIGIDIIGYMDRIDVTVSVGDVVTFDGAA